MADLMNAIGQGAVIAVTIRAIDEYSSQFKKASTSMQKFGVAAKGFAVAGVSALAAFTVSSIKAGIESEKVGFRVRQSYGKMAEEVLRASSKMQDASIQNDEVIGQAFVDLQTKTQSLGLTFQQQSGLIQNSLDLAAKTGMDFNQVSDAISMGLMGQTRGLKQLGIEISSTASKQEILNAITTRGAQASGAAKAETETFGGQLSQLANQYDEVKEAVSKGLLPQLQLLNTELLEHKDNWILVGTAIGTALTNMAIGADATLNDIITLFENNYNKRLKPIMQSLGLLDKAPLIGVSSAGIPGIPYVGKDTTEQQGPTIKSAGDIKKQTFDEWLKMQKEGTETTKESTKSIEDKQLIEAGYTSWEIANRKNLEKSTFELITKMDEGTQKNYEFKSSLSTMFNQLKFELDTGAISVNEFSTAMEMLKKSAQGLSSPYDRLKGTGNTPKLVYDANGNSQTVTTGGRTISGRITTSPKYSDFISRPGMPTSTFSPDDTIIGVKNPSKLGGGGVNVYINELHGADPEDMADALRRRLGDLVAL